MGAQLPETATVCSSLSYPALLFDWLITLTLLNCDNIILDQSAWSKSGVHVDFIAQLAPPGLCSTLVVALM